MRHTQARENARAGGYEQPAVRDYGSLVELTEDCSGGVLPPGTPDGMPFGLGALVSAYACPSP